MTKLPLTIFILIAVLVFFSGCEFDAGTALSKVGNSSKSISEELPESGDFFKLERLDTKGDQKQYIEVSYDGKVKLNTDKATEKISTVTKEEVAKMSKLIKARDFDGLKKELKLDNSGATDLKETLTLFSESGRAEILDITPADLQSEENTILPDKWDVYLTKVRRFFGALTGEPY
jgi:hypothetical protein